MKTSRILTTTIAALLLAPALHAADRFWTDTLGGPFADINNWSATDGGANGASVPGVADIANFTLINTYTVTFAAGATNTDLDVENGNVTFSLGGFTYTLSSSTGVAVGNVSGQTGRLTVTDGTLALDTSGESVFIGSASSGSGFLTISTGGRLGTAALRPSIFVGLNSTGTLTVNANGRIDGDILSLGTNNSTTTGTAVITGQNAVADFSGSTFIGANGTGTLTVSNGGTLVSTGTSALGNSLSADGTATVSGIGSSWIMGSTASIGGSGDGMLTISSGGLVSTAGTVTLGSSSTGFGTVTVTGAGSQFTSTGTQTIGSSGTGTLNISSGGRVEGTSTAIVGSGSSGEGRVTVSGAGSIWSVPNTVVVGNSGAGTVTVSSGGEFVGSAITIGGNGLGVGTVTVTGAGSVMTASSIFISNLGTGTLNVENGAEVYTNSLTVNDPAGTPVGTLNLDGGSIFVGGTFTRNGAFNFTTGLLRVGGSFAPNPSAAAFTLNGTTNADLPTLDLIGNGAITNVTTLNIGTTRRGQVSMRQNRLSFLEVSEINLGTTASGEGLLSVESGAQLFTSGSLNIGGSSFFVGGAGTLNITNGTVDVGTLRLQPGGVINFNGGILAADSMPALGGQFNWISGELRLDAASTTFNSTLASKLFGPAKTLRAGQSLTTFDTGGHVVDFTTSVTVDGGFVNVETLNTASTLDLRSGIVSGVTTTNSGLVQLGGPLAQFGGTTFTNSGTIRGSGQLFGGFTNAVAGRVEVIAGERMIFDTLSGAVNAGTISVIGGELQLNNTLTNAASTGLISARDAILRTSGVTNNGSFAFSNGTVDFYGDITQNVGGRITVSNGGIANFYDDVVIQPGAASVQATALGATISRVVFFGSYNGGITGGGQAFIEGDHRPGNSPALITFGGDVVYGTFATLEMELGGTARGTQYDAMNVAGSIGFNGTMNVPLIGGFQPALGNVFNLFDFGSRTGTFSTVILPALNPGLAWSQANLYTAGEIQVALDPVFISRTWDGGGANNNWITDANWTLDVQPLNNATADLIFTGNVRLTPSVDTPWNVHSITFNNTAGAFTITGPQDITMGAGGIVNNDTQTQTITAAITLSANETFNAAAGDLAISSVALAGQTLAISGANDVTLATASGTGTINKNNTGRLDITGALGTGGVTVNANAGTTNIGFSETLAALTIGNGATVTLGAIPPAPAPAFGIGDGSELLDANVQPIPEPGIGALLASTLALLGIGRRFAGR